MKKTLLVFTLLVQFLALGALAQQTIKGKVIDSLTKETLPGAVVSLKGAGLSTSTSSDGSFSIKKQDGANVLVISYIGYNRKEVVVPAGTTDLGSITLVSSSNTMDEVMIIANNVAIDRKTPVAVSTVDATRLEEKLSNQEFPEILKSTPGVYATRSGGGFGDSRMNLRGFQSANVAVMVNGVPVNDPESGRVFWSNWSGLGEVMRSTQVQRGLGASKVAVPSIGGTVNIITKSTDMAKGGFIYQGFGNNDFNKTTFSYSTGLTDKNWAFTVLGSKQGGDGWAEGLYYKAYTYFFNVSKIINAHHTLSLTGFGAPQYHAQRFDRLTIETYRDAPQGIKFNPNWGVYNGKDKTISGNFFHKPQFSLNHYWTIDDKSSLSTAIYYSIGTGGNEFDSNLSGGVNFDDVQYRKAGKYSPLDLDKIAALNAATTDGKAVAYLQSNRNDHKWYGMLSTYNRKIGDKFNVLGGIDLRSYKGIHYNSVRNLLGAEYVLDASNLNNPVNMAKTGDKIGFYNDGLVRWEGVFVQGEYSDGPLSTFISLAGSNTSYKRIDYFRYLNTDPLRESSWQNFLGYQAKGGANYNISEQHNIFANLGHFEKAPFFNAIFIGNQNVPNKDAVNEKITSYELGYGFRSQWLTANLNLYRTRWNDRSFTRSITGQGGARYFANLVGVDALHQGIELDFVAKPVKDLSINGMVSLGNWKWKNNLAAVQVYDENQQPVGSPIGPVYMSGLKVGDSPQTTAAIGVNYNLTEEFKIGVDYNYYANFNAEFDPTTLTKQGLTPWEVPNYSLVDVNAVFRFKLGNFKASLFGNVNNLFNVEYISDGYANFDPSTGISNASNSTVYFGTGRTFTTGLKINF
ncbi:TonB-dependent receptor [Pedobacter heparinus]|uniref:TonB-dependent receptor n=1 Tax=Pedobacter heparinus (strain ATCC 13125 / DSM 2366 / CIP 104194 / JCM 7457 / NBRC 12017 / NCIMB 9290 / NRRL B-14731 / HIM 762-3) TaxID=485917 RepID=C6Y2I8_PEDHD|nr:TonB-dependent receptor [Pedobacter heparinus]ACU05198.1 TonB-dependent receptor [Pedobacter heparinus DSM 2366]